jgi:uncharacterized protein YjbJ (UPF0337 family)
LSAYTVPGQNLSIPLHRIPTRPTSGLIMSEVRTYESTTRFHPPTPGWSVSWWVSNGRETLWNLSERRFAMGLDDKADNKSEELAGKVKEGAGKATDDEDLEAEGKADQSAANLKQAGEKIKDAFKS